MGDSSSKSSGRTAWRIWSTGGQSGCQLASLGFRDSSERTCSPVVVSDLEIVLDELAVVALDDLEQFRRKRGCLPNDPSARALPASAHIHAHRSPVRKSTRRYSFEVSGLTAPIPRKRTMKLRGAPTTTPGELAGV